MEKSRGTLSFKITLVIIMLAAFSILLTTFLNFSNFEKRYSALISSRYMVVQNDIRNSIEYQLNLGLSLAEMKNVQEMLEHLKASDQSIRSLSVFDDKGRILFSEDRASVGRDAPSAWVEEMRKFDKKYLAAKDKKETGVCYLRATDRIVTGVPLLNSFNVRVGTLALGYPRELVAAPVKNVLIATVITALAVFIACALITLFGISRLSRGLRKSFDALRTEIGTLPAEAAARTACSENAEIETHGNAFTARARAVLRDFDQIEKSAKGASR